MSRDEIEALVARRQLAWDAHDAHALAQDHAEDVVKSPLGGGATAGREAIERLYTTSFRAFTVGWIGVGLRMEIRDASRRIGTSPVQRIARHDESAPGILG